MSNQIKKYRKGLEIKTLHPNQKKFIQWLIDRDILKKYSLIVKEMIQDNIYYVKDASLLNKYLSDLKLEYLKK